MAEPSVLDEDTILRTIREWPREQQVHLARMILDPGLATLDPQTGRPYVTSEELRGIGAGNNPPPTDEDIERWRMEKYGE
ncbi:MAG TPA: hypothetical protein VFX24_08845 [Ktedonobacterales bacterium]|jgi:hypothetical protein|nr:hypothetical protein [Ktedonobacterales bacterium]